MAQDSKSESLLLVGTRLKQAREAMGLSQREGAEKVSVSVTSWQNYEAGRNTPGGEVLMALSRMGVNINWLLAGLGEMFQHSLGNDELTDRGLQNTTTSQDRHRLLQAMGVEQLMMPAEMAYLVQEWEISTALRRAHPDSISFDEISYLLHRDGLGLDERRLELVLDLLRRRGLVEELEKSGRFRATNPRSRMVARDIPGFAHTTLAAVRSLCRDVCPTAETNVDNVRLLNGRLSVNPRRAADALRKIKSFTDEWGAEFEDINGEAELVAVVGCAYLGIPEKR